MAGESYLHHVFLSGSRKDTDAMHRVCDDLCAEGLAVWTDQTGLEPGTMAWEMAITQAVKGAGCMVVLLSPDAAGSASVDKEIATAEEWGLRIFPVLVRGTPREAVPARLAGRQHIDARSDYSAALRKLIGSVSKHLGVESLSASRLGLAPEGAAAGRARPQRLPRVSPAWTWIGGGVVGVAFCVAAALCVGAVVGGLSLSGVFDGIVPESTLEPPSPTEGAFATPTARPAEPTRAPTAIPTEPAHIPVEVPPLAFEGVAHNAHWEPVTHDFDGVPMALVPAGCFMMGSSEDSEEQPIHQVCFEEPFWIDVYEVTNEQYGSTGNCVYVSSSDPDQPRNCLGWARARDHCESRGARLPTEAEWEYAARGPDGLVYPWGNQFVADCVVYGGNSAGQTAHVGSRPGGVSWVGAYDMSGNVNEWVNDWFGPYPSEPQVNPGGPSSGETRVLRGGSWNLYIRHFLSGSIRIRSDPASWDDYSGFRCARSY